MEGMFWGRSFNLYGNRPKRSWWERLLRKPEHPRPYLGLVWPCQVCGIPQFPGQVHVCEGKQAAVIEEFEQQFEEGQ